MRWCMPQPEKAVSVQGAGIRAISVGDFMTRELVTLEESDDLVLAERALRLGGIRHLPVVRGGKLVGLVTQRDLLRSAATRAPEQTRAADVMVRDPTCVQASTSLVH